MDWSGSLLTEENGSDEVGEEKSPEEIESSSDCEDGDHISVSFKCYKCESG